MKDNRDPKVLGETIIALQRDQLPNRVPLRQVADFSGGWNVPDYLDEGPVERYGDPRLIPSTLPN